MEISTFLHSANRIFSMLEIHIWLTHTFSTCFEFVEILDTPQLTQHMMGRVVSSEVERKPGNENIVRF